METSSQGAELLWRDLKLFARGADGGSKAILKGVSGAIKPSTMVALMGTSGAGKTTLMNALAGRIPPSLHLRGEILLNSFQRSKDTWPGIVGYVEQEFHAYEYQTVFETLLFASKIKMGTEETGPKVLSRIDEVIGLLGLKNAKNTYIARLSGGERKRVSIGVELLGNPSVLFCDEPTSGLDSFNATNILGLLKDLSKMGKTVLVTIHQPSYEMIEFFDKMILISLGQVVYDGDVEGCIDFFGECGHPLPKLTNPMDFFLKTISLDTRTRSGEERSLETISHISRQWGKRRKCPEPSLHEEVQAGRSPIKSSLSFSLLLGRNLLDHARNTEYLKIRVFQKLFLILVFGLAYLQIGYSVESIYTRLGGITFILTNALFGVCSPIFNVFSAEKMVIFRERRSGMYTGFMAFLAKYVSEVAVNFLFEAPYIVIIYWMIGLNSNAGVFFVFLIIVSSLMLFSIAYSLAVSTMASTHNNAQVLGSMGLLVFLVYSGSFNNPNTIPGWLRWLNWVSPVYYATKASFQNQLSGVVFSGADGQQQTGEQQIASRGLEGTGVWPCILIIWGITFAWAACGAVVLHYTTKNNMKVEVSKDEASMDEV